MDPTLNPDDATDLPSLSEKDYAGGEGGDLAMPFGSSAQATAQARQERASPPAPAIASAYAIDVRSLQTWLNAHGFASPLLTVDGKLGPKSAAAIKAFQTSRGLVADGIPGPKTYAATLGPPPPMPAVFSALSPAGAAHAAVIAAASPAANKPPTPPMPKTFAAPAATVSAASMTGALSSKTKVLGGLAVLGIGAFFARKRFA